MICILFVLSFEFLFHVFLAHIWASQKILIDENLVHAFALATFWCSNGRERRTNKKSHTQKNQSIKLRWKIVKINFCSNKIIFLQSWHPFFSSFFSLKKNIYSWSWENKEDLWGKFVSLDIIYFIFYFFGGISQKLYWERIKEGMSVLNHVLFNY